MPSNLLLAKIIGPCSFLVALGKLVTMRTEITDNILDIYGFQLDLNVSPFTGAPDLTIQSIAKGDSITTAPDVDSHPPLPTSNSPVRIGLPTEIPAPGEPRASFGGPGSIVDITFAIPADAVSGQSYQVSLTDVILAGPGNQAIQQARGELELNLSAIAASFVALIFVVIANAHSSAMAQIIGMRSSVVKPGERKASEHS